MEKYVFQLAKMTWATAAVWSFGLAAGYYFLMYDSGTAIEQRITEAQSQKIQIEAILTETEKNLRDSERFENDVRIAVGQFEKVIEYMPKQLNMAELTTMISGAASAVGAKIMKIEPQSGKGVVGGEPSTKVPFYEVARIDVVLEGSFSELVSFLSQITKVPRLLTFESIELASIPDSQSDRPKLALSGTLLGYKYVERPAEPAATSQQEGQNGESH